MLEYARFDDHPASRSLYGTGYDERIYFPFSYVLLEGEGHIALIDTGFDPNSTFINGFLHETTVSRSRSARDVLAKVGVEVGEIDTVLLTHAHFDHMGNLAAFPNAEVWLQARELEWIDRALRLPAAFSALTEALDPADLLTLEQVKRDGRLHLADGLQKDVLPGIDLVPAFETHTEGSQYVAVRSGEETWVMTGDNAYAYRNVETGPDQPGYLGIGYGTGSLWRSLEVIDEMLGVADGSARLMIPHEGETFSRFPSKRWPDGLAVAEMRLAPGVASRL
jgi:glyoxylase-like metal-dependent hydrolase (beta-lactamase superfamily II)